ncbi:MAG: pyridoxamine 5'-phosphate oxidase family protein [Methylacidiphilales bacterium]|nr:pyridoxamine 5'-phosphate oxidase family protein [Candidatus Methylacidiphilales bacterium]
MKRPISPSPAKRTQKEGSLSANDGDRIARLAYYLADGSRPGILTTVDPSGRPHARWMPTIGFGDFPYLYSTTSPGSPELDHLEHQPYVNWMFGNESRSVVVNLTGTARVVTEAALINRIWELRTERARQLYKSRLDTGLGFILIETEVENIECNIPREKFKILTDFLAHAEGRCPVSLRWSRE